MADPAPTGRRSPRLSLNALAHYMAATAGQRESILREQKFPPEYKQVWYREATNTIIRFLLDEDQDEEILVRAIDRYLAAGGSQHEQKRLKYNAEALQGFLGGYGELATDSLELARGSRSGTLAIEGVTISIRPEILLSGTYRGQRVCGGLKLYLSRSERLTDDSAAHIGALLFRYSGTSSPRASRRHCQVMDVFVGDVFAAPTATARRMNDIEAACREIALRWPSITARRR